MADPLSVAASIVTVLGLAQSVKRCLIDIREASKDCSKILLELSMISGILFTLKDNIERAKEGPSWLSTMEALAMPNGPLAHFKAMLEHLMSCVEPMLGPKKVGRALTWPFKKQEVKDILQSIERQKALFILAFENDNQTLIRQIKSDLSDVKEVVKHLEQASLDEKDLIVLDWLSPLSPQRKQQDIRSRRLPDTGSWFLERPEFEQWCSDISSPNVIWCPGIPGAGKTNIASIVIDHLNKRNVGSQNRLAYIYYDYNDEEAQTTVNVIGSILKQLASQQHSLPDSVNKLYDKLGKRQGQPQLEDLVLALIEICQDSHTTTVVIDALDECRSAKARQEILKIIGRLVDVSARFLITSRPHVDGIHQALSGFPQIIIEANTSDITKYVTETIEQDEGIADFIDEELKDEIIKEICQDSHGMFLLPALQVQDIVSQTTKAEVRQALWERPKELHTALEQTLTRIRQQPLNKSRLAMRVLMWLTHLKGPLSKEGLRYALAVRIGDTHFNPENVPSAKSIIECCFGLVNEKNFSFRLMHFTIKEYLSDTQRGYFPTGQQDMTNVCLTYLNSNGILKVLDKTSNKTMPWRLAARLGQDPNLGSRSTHFMSNFFGKAFIRNTAEGNLNFLAYATLYWSHHARDTSPATYEVLAIKLLSDEVNRRRFIKIFNYVDYNRRPFDSFDAQATGLHIASLFNMENLVQTLLSQEPSAVNAQDSSGRTALHMAADGGCLEAAQVLLSAGADLEIHGLISLRRDSTHFQGTALHIAVQSKEISMVRLLLDRGANVDAKSSEGKTPLMYAVIYGYFDIIRALVCRGANMTLRDVSGIDLLDQMVPWKRDIIQQFLKESQDDQRKVR